MPIGCRISPDI